MHIPDNLHNNNTTKNKKDIYMHLLLPGKYEYV